MQLSAQAARSADTLTAAVDARGRIRVATAGSSRVLHPLWVRDRSTEPADVDPTNRQRLYDPDAVSLDLRAIGASVVGEHLQVDFDDGTRVRVRTDVVTRILHDEADPEDPPAPKAWVARNLRHRAVEWADLTSIDETTSDRALACALDQFFRNGFFVLRGTAAQPGALHAITAPFGRISATNFGTLFDVRSVREPVDLAYTPVALAAHLDQPYRHPSPSIQFLHTICNDADGGESTVVDGLHAVIELQRVDPAAARALSDLDVEFRYDMGSDVVVGRAPIIETRRDGRLRQLRYSPRVDFPPAADPDILDSWYRGRRWLADHFDDPANRVLFKMAAGDVLVVDNHRVLHGRCGFDPATGGRHLQGCYIDHDGPDTAWRLLRRRCTSRANAAECA